MQTLVEIGHSNASQVQDWKKDATEQMKNLTLARTRTQVAVISSADALATKQLVPVAEPEFYPYKLSDLIFTPLPSLHVDFFSTCCYLVFFCIICPVLISLYNIAVLIIICSFESTLLLKYANPCRNWTFQRVVSAGLKKGRNGTNEKSDARQNSNPGPRHF